MHARSVATRDLRGGIGAVVGDHVHREAVARIVEADGAGDGPPYEDLLVVRRDQHRKAQHPFGTVGARRNGPPSQGRGSEAREIKRGQSHENGQRDGDQVRDGHRHVETVGGSFTVRIDRPSDQFPPLKI